MRKWSTSAQLLHTIDLFSQISEEYWCGHWVSIGVNMAKKKESYRDRWLREHSRISLYLI
jgi:hypothetical protein